MRKKILFALFIFFCIANQNTFALELQVNATNETCTGNGVLTFNVSSETVGIPVFYSIYLLPNTTTPLFSTNLNSYGGLVSGNYLVVASQTENGITTSAQENVSILNQIDLLNYSITSQSVKCGNDGQITVNVTSGNPVSYQLLTGPVVTGLQTSNIFQNLVAGQYNIRVFDSCGEALVQTFILTALSNSLNIGPPNIYGNANLSCDLINIYHILSPTINTQIFFPLNVQITAYPPSGGSPIITNEVVNSSSSTLITNIPAINGVGYQYDLLFTDVCGNQYIRNNNNITQVMGLIIERQLENCNDYRVKLTMSNIIPPFTVNFTSFPSGFNPVLVNSNHPGPYAGNTVTYGNSPNYMPFGNYTVLITDSCGKTATGSFVIEELPSVPNSIVTSSGCGTSANISIGLNLPRSLANVTLVSAPSNYPNTIPQDLSTFIVGGVLYFQNILPGTYSFSLVDVCGNPYTETVLVEGNIQLPSVLQRPGCTLGEGSIQIKFDSNPIAPLTIIGVEIIEAPQLFGFSLPFNASFNISSTGFFSMNSLPEGNYKFKILDSCGIENIIEVSVVGFEITNSLFSLTENCGSINLQLNHNSNGNFLASYFLQKYDSVNNVWEHPSSGIDYIEGTPPSTINSVLITNNFNNLNLAFSGTFRILKSYYNFSNGSDIINLCVIPLHEFEFFGGPKIIDAFAFPCSNSTQEVIIVASGLPPLNYKITTKNGQVFTIDNNTSNVFTGLESASYNFEVSDICGNIVNRIFDVSVLPLPEIIASNFCNGENGQLQIQDFPFVDYQWYNVANPSVILSTSSALQFSPFNSSLDVGTYAVQLSTTNANSCVNQTIQYTINPSGFNPNAGEDNSLSLCRDDQQIGLNTFLTNPHDNGGVWTDSNGAVISSIINPSDLSVGVYEFTYTVNGFCSISDSATVEITIKDLPATPVVTVPTPICRGDLVQLNTNSVANATYFWTGPNGFTSTEQNPVIQGFNASNDGSYFVYVTVEDCNSATQEVVINSNPLPDFSIDGATSLCIGLNETLTINSTNFDVTLASINWYFNDILLSTETSSSLQINQIGTYKAIVNINGCSSEREIEVVEKINSFEVVLEQGCNGNEYEIKVVNATDFPNATYSWTGPNGFVSFSQNIIVPNLQLGTYTVEVEDVSGCKSSNFALVENTNCFIPNGFSPDDDGFNDYFDLTGYGVKKIYIYNRYGRLIYDKDNYINEWKGQTNDNQRVPAATYFYVLEFNEGENKTGWVYVSY